MREHFKRLLEDYSGGKLSKEKLKEELFEWLTEPFQPDIADYFMNGPGRKYEPFLSILRIAEE